MGNTQPTNKTGRKVVAQKLENAGKTGILSLSEHKLDTFPSQIFELTNLKTLDVSKNELTQLPSTIGTTLTNLKILNLDDNQFSAGTVQPIQNLTKLQNLSLGGNRLGRPNNVVTANSNSDASPKTTTTYSTENALPTLPATLKQLKVNSNFFSNVPTSITSSHLTKLEKLDLSSNHLASVPDSIANLKQLIELNLDDNSIVSLPSAIGQLGKLKQLSLRNNHISVHSTIFTEKNPQPLPASLFTDTPLIDLNLHGNPLTSTALNNMEGYQVFLERREKVKTKDLYGGALTNLDVCGLE